MSKLKNKRMVSVLLSLIMIVILSSCGKTGLASNAGTSNSGSSNSEPQEEVKEEPNEWLLFEREHYDEVSFAINMLKGELKNPRSLEISDIIYYKSNAFGNITSNVVIIYSAQNDLGNAIASDCVVTNMQIISTSSESTVTNAENIAKGRSNIASIEIWDGLYASSNDLDNNETTYAFYVDLDDFDEIKGF